MMKFVSIYSVFLVLFLSGFSQPPQISSLMPKVLQGSPDAAAFAKYGNYDVNLFTGVPQISIPLFEVQVGELKVPIAISYHASGNRVSEVPSSVGIGWSLSAGGSITRRLMGKPDEQSGGYFEGNTVQSTANINTYTSAGTDYLWDGYHGVKDYEPDIFSYDFPGNTGRFFYDQKNNLSVVKLPFSPVAINKISNGPSNINFDITDERGVVHKFATQEWTADNSVPAVSAISTWQLSQMISSNKQDTIYFNYETRTGSGTTDVQPYDYFVLSDLVDNYNNSNYFSPDGGNSYTGQNTSSTIWQRLSEIVFRNGKIVFEASTQAREDFGIWAPVMQNRLSKMRVFSLDKITGTYILVRTVQFYHSYFIQNGIAESKRLRLDSISITGSNDVDVEKYRFDYNNTIGFPKKITRSKDYWGYLNRDPSWPEESTLMPRMAISYQPFAQNAPSTLYIGASQDGTRDPNPNFIQVGILTRITYPTAGYSEFDFEANQYLEGGNMKYAGGLRIKQIRTYDGVSTVPIVKSYKYGENETGYGRKNFNLSFYFFQNEQYYKAFDESQPALWLCGKFLGIKRVRTFFSNPTIDIEPYDGSPVNYPFVTEYFGTESSNTGKIIYQFNDQPDGMNTVAGYGRPIISTYHFNRGQIINRTEYKRLSSGAYQKVSEQINAYEAFPQQWKNEVALFVFKKYLYFNSWGEEMKLPAYDPQNGCSPGKNDSESYLYANYSIRTADHRIVQAIERRYDENTDTKYVQNSTNYYYDNFGHMQVTRTVATNSLGETIQTTKKYTLDAPYASAQPYSSMAAGNILNKVIEESSTNNSNPVSKVFTPYSNFGGSNFQPSEARITIGNAAEQTRVVFSKYNSRGSVQEMRKSDDLNSSYIWDYQMMYPVAEVINASESDIAYTSFESDGKGNWLFSGVPILEPSAPTGKRAYKLTAGQVSKVGISASKSYWVSYWTKNASAYSITGNMAGYPIQGALVNGWRLFIHKIVGQTSVSISGSGVIDELRLYPVNAQMKTFTYDPLIGISSESDVNNRITYYRYDAAGRLKLILDQNLNARKAFCYNYFGQPVDCGGVFQNAPLSQSYTKSCGAGYIGSSVSYTVPGARYYSTISQQDADAKAQAEADAYGQDQANATGTCVLAQTVRGYNSKTSTYQVKFTNTSTGLWYTFYLNPYTYSFSNLGQIPSGTYTVQFYPAGSPVTATFVINGYTQYATGGATFYNISVNSLTSAYMY